MHDTGELTFIGTATVLLRWGGLTLLTDPNFLRRGERAYGGLGVTTRRLTDPACRLEELPDLDAVVLSHHHGDHFDRRAASGLDRDLPIVTEPHAARKLISQGFRRPVALRRWERHTLHGPGTTVTVHAAPARHAPGPLGLAVPPVMGSVLELAADDGPVRMRIYISGDTILHPAIAEVGQRFGPIDLCLVHLGGTRIAGVLLTMDDRQGVEFLRTVGPRRAIPVHYDDYTLFRSPLDDFRARVDRSGLAPIVTYLARGDTHRFDVPAGSAG